MQEAEDIKKRLRYLELKFGLSEYDPAIEGYAVLVKLLKDQNSYLDKISIKDLIASEDSGKKAEFERAKGLWEKLPDLIKKLRELKYELDIEPKEEKKIEKPISAKDIANGDVLPN